MERIGLTFRTMVGSLDMCVFGLFEL
jgi:hypothetical protein